MAGSVKLPDDAGRSVQVLTAAQFALHVRRVELLVSLLAGIVTAAKQNPLFAGAIPDELLTELNELNAESTDD